MIVIMPSRKRMLVPATNDAIASSGAWSPRMEKMPSKMTITRPVPSGTRRDGRQIRKIVVLKDRTLRRGDVRDPHRADDAVVVERVADPERVGPDKSDRAAKHGRVGRVEHLGRPAVDEASDLSFELSVRREVPSMNRTAPGPTPNACDALSAA